MLSLDTIRSGFDSILPLYKYLTVTREIIKRLPIESKKDFQKEKGSLF